MLLFIASNLHPFLYNRYLYVPMFVFAGFAACLRRPVGGSALAAVAAA